MAELGREPVLYPVTYADDKAYYVSESSVYRLIKALDLITSPTYILMQASDKFQLKGTEGINFDQPLLWWRTFKSSISYLDCHEVSGAIPAFFDGVSRYELR